MKIHYIFDTYTEFHTWLLKYNIDTKELSEIDIVMIHEHK